MAAPALDRRPGSARARLRRCLPGRQRTDRLQLRHPCAGGQGLRRPGFRPMEHVSLARRPLRGCDTLAGRAPEVGRSGAARARPWGSTKTESTCSAPAPGSLHADIESLGLLRVMVEGIEDGDTELSWGSNGDLTGSSACSLSISATALTLVGRDDDGEAWRQTASLQLDTGAHALQVRDDGREVLVLLDGVGVLSAPQPGTPDWNDDVAGTLLVRLSGSGRMHRRPRSARAADRRPRRPPPDRCGRPAGRRPAVVRGRFRGADPRARRHGRRAGGFVAPADGSARLEVPTAAQPASTPPWRRRLWSRTTYLLDWPDPTHCDIEFVGSPPPATDDKGGQRCRYRPGPLAGRLHLHDCQHLSRQGLPVGVGVHLLHLPGLRGHLRRGVVEPRRSRVVGQTVPDAARLGRRALPGPRTTSRYFIGPSATSTPRPIASRSVERGSSPTGRMGPRHGKPAAPLRGPPPRHPPNAADQR